MIKFLWPLFGVPLAVAVAGLTAPRDASVVARTIELGHRVQAGDCSYVCESCSPPFQGHAVESVGGGGTHTSAHPEPCNEWGDCSNHECGPDAPNPDDVQGLLDGVEGATDEELMMIVGGLPTLFALDDARQALLVRGCRQGTFIARFPVSKDVSGDLTKLASG